MLHKPYDDERRDSRQAPPSDTDGSNLSIRTPESRKVAPERTASSPSLKFSLGTLKALVDLLKTLEACHVDTSTGESSARPPP